MRLARSGAPVLRGIVFAILGGRIALSALSETISFFSKASASYEQHSGGKHLPGIKEQQETYNRGLRVSRGWLVSLLLSLSPTLGMAVTECYCSSLGRRETASLFYVCTRNIPCTRYGVYTAPVWYTIRTAVILVLVKGCAYLRQAVPGTAVYGRWGTWYNSCT